MCRSASGHEIAPASFPGRHCCPRAAEPKPGAAPPKKTKRLKVFEGFRVTSQNVLPVILYEVQLPPGFREGLPLLLSDPAVQQEEAQPTWS